MKKIVNLTAVAIVISCSALSGKEIDRMEHQAISSSFLAGVAEKSKEIVNNVKDSIEQKQYEHHMKAAQEAKVKATQKAHDLQVQSEQSAQHAQESAARAKQIAELIEADTLTLVAKDSAQQKYENYLRAAQRAKEKADHDAFYYQLKSKKAAEQAYESALNANLIAKHIETEQKAHALNEKFKKALHESDRTN
jgi:hypothetical protein